MALLPQELIDRVVDFVGCSATLASMARCSKRLHRTATHHLYQNVHIVHQSEPEFFINRLKDVAIHLLRHPQLAGMVETLTLSHPCITMLPSIRQVSAAEEELIATTVQKLAHPFLAGSSNMIVDKLTPTRCEFYIALLLAALPHVRTYHFYPPENLAAAYWYALGAHYMFAPITKSPFVPLETLVLDGREWPSLLRARNQFLKKPLNVSLETSDFQWADEMVSHIVPHVQAFNPRRLIIFSMGESPARHISPIHGTSYRTEFANYRTKTPRPNLRFVEIRGTSVTINGLATFILCPAELQTFIYEHPPTPLFSIESLLVILALHKDTLSHLGLDTQFFYQSENSLDLNLLHDFICLERLEIAATYLTGCDILTEYIATSLRCLPPTIKTLCILKAEYCPQVMIEILLMIVSGTQDLIPRVDKLEIDGLIGEDVIYEIEQHCQAVKTNSSIIQSRIIDITSTLLPRVPLEEAYPARESGWTPGPVMNASFTALKNRRLIIDMAKIRAYHRGQKMIH